jgi:hypothetical protein
MMGQRRQGGNPKVGPALPCGFEGEVGRHRAEQPVHAGYNAETALGLQGPCPQHQRQLLRNFALCNLQAKPEREEGMQKWLGLGLLLGAALGSIASAQTSANFDGQYMGELTLTKIINGDCTKPPLGALYPLTISRGEVRLAYLPRFGTTLRGNVDANGILKASAHLRKGYLQVTGHIQGNNLTAYIKSPSCNYTFQTKN